MNQATALSCPSCGAGLGPMEGNQYRCAFCGHLSLPPRPVIDQTQRAQMVAALLGQFDDRRARAMSARDELRKRQHDALASTRTTNGWVMLGVGGLFLLFALGCFGAAVAMAVSSNGAAASAGSRHHGHAAAPPPTAHASMALAGPIVFGLFWVALGGSMFYVGVRYRRAGIRDKTMRASGLRGTATVRSYKESNLLVDGNRKFDLVLEVDLPGRPPFVVRQSDYVPHPSAVTTGADLPVFVNPSNQTDVMVDWFTIGRD